MQRSNPFTSSQVHGVASEQDASFQISTGLERESPYQGTTSNTNSLPFWLFSRQSPPNPPSFSSYPSNSNRQNQHFEVNSVQNWLFREDEENSSTSGLLSSLHLSNLFLPSSTSCSVSQSETYLHPYDEELSETAIAASRTSASTNSVFYDTDSLPSNFSSLMLRSGTSPPSYRSHTNPFVSQLTPTSRPTARRELIVIAHLPLAIQMPV